MENVSNDLQRSKEISKQNNERSICFPFAAYDEMYSEKCELKKKLFSLKQNLEGCKKTGFAGFENKTIFHSWLLQRAKESK